MSRRIKRLRASNQCRMSCVTRHNGVVIRATQLGGSVSVPLGKARIYHPVSDARSAIGTSTYSVGKTTLYVVLGNTSLERYNFRRAVRAEGGTHGPIVQDGNGTWTCSVLDVDISRLSHLIKSAVEVRHG
jgi:hypothetical protein